MKKRGKEKKGKKRGKGKEKERGKKKKKRKNLVMKSLGKKKGWWKLLKWEEMEKRWK